MKKLICLMLRSYYYLRFNMENQNTIIALLCVIIALLAVLAIMFSPLMTREASNLAIDDKEINAGDSLVVKLTDGNGNPIPNETINIKLTDKEGTTIDEDITTNSKGNANLKIEETGNYSVVCSFNGNNQFASTSTAGNVTVKKATTEVVNEEQTSTTTHASKYAPNGGIYPEYGPEVDTYGVTREYAIAHDWHYLELIIDGKDRGGYAAIDSTTGTYHT